MKKRNEIFIFPFLFLFISANSLNDFSGCGKKLQESTSSSDSLLFIRLKELDKKKFINLTVDSLLEDETVSKYKSYNFFDEPLSVLNRLSLWYNKEIQLDIYISEYKYVKRIDGSRKWSFTEFRKEKISKIDLIYSGKVVEIIGEVLD